MERIGHETQMLKGIYKCKWNYCKFVLSIPCLEESFWNILFLQTKLLIVKSKGLSLGNCYSLHLDQQIINLEFGVTNNNLRRSSYWSCYNLCRVSKFYPFFLIKFIGARHGNTLGQINRFFMRYYSYIFNSCSSIVQIIWYLGNRRIWN